MAAFPGVRPPAWALLALMLGAVGAALPSNLPPLVEQELSRRIVGEDADHNYTLFRPAQADEKVETKWQMALTSIDELDEKESTITMQFWLRCSWKDTRGAFWDPAENGVHQLQPRSNQVWTPDHVIHNMIEKNVIADSSVYMYADGSYYWSVPQRVKLNCKFALTNFPYDKQNCTVVVGAWSFHGGLQDLAFMQSADGKGLPVDFSNFVQKENQWTLMKMTAGRHDVKYLCCPVKWPVLTWSFEVQRSSFPYDISLTIPYIAVTYLSLLSLIVHPNSGERIGLGMTCLLTLMAINFILADLLPMVKYVTGMATLYLLSFSTCVFATFASVVSINLHQTGVGSADSAFGYLRVICHCPLKAREQKEKNFRENKEAARRFTRKSTIRRRASLMSVSPGGEPSEELESSSTSRARLPPISNAKPSLSGPPEAKEDLPADQDLDLLKEFLDEALPGDAESIQKVLASRVTIDQLPTIHEERWCYIGLDLGVALRLTHQIDQQLGPLSKVTDFSHVSARFDKIALAFFFVFYTISLILTVSFYGSKTAIRPEHFPNSTELQESLVTYG